MRQKCCALGEVGVLAGTGSCLPYAMPFPAVQSPLTPGPVLCLNVLCVMRPPAPLPQHTTAPSWTLPLPPSLLSARSWA